MRINGWMIFYAALSLYFAIAAIGGMKWGAVFASVYGFVAGMESNKRPNA